MTALLEQTLSTARRGSRFVAEALSGSDQDFTRGSLNRAIFLLAIPMMLEMIMESVFAIVDIFFVSRLGADAVATLGLTEAVLTLLYAIAIGLSMGVTALVARRVGEGDPAAAARVAAQALWLGGGISLAISIPGAFYADAILAAMGLDAAAIATHGTYARIMFGGSGSILMLFLLNGVFRGAGDASIAMRVLWFANAINIVLDPCLIFGLGPFPELGLAGAATATTIGRSLAVGLQLYYLFGNHHRIRVNRTDLLPNVAGIHQIVVISLGGMAQFFIATSSWLFMMKIVAGYGSAAIAGYTIAIRVIDFIILPAWGLSNAAATLVGQNLGAGHVDRAERSVYRVAAYNFAFMMTVGILFIAFPASVLGIFAQDPDALAYGISALRWLSYGFGAFALGLVLMQAFNGAGDTYTPTWINFLAFWLLQLPLAWVLATQIMEAPVGVFISALVGETAMSLLAYAVFRRGRWKTVSV